MTIASAIAKQRCSHENHCVQFQMSQFHQDVYEHDQNVVKQIGTVRDGSQSHDQPFAE